MPTIPRGRILGALACAVLIVCGALAVPAHADDSDAPQIDTDYGRMMLVLDSSGSMAEKSGGTTKISQAKQALDTVVDDLPSEAYVGLRVFGAKVFSSNDKGACQDTQLVVEPGTGNRTQLKQAVDSYKPYGETPIPAALQAAADDLGNEGMRSLVLVSDGESTCAPDPCKVAADIADDGVDVQIDVIGMSVGGKARKQLQCVAERGGGTYYDAKNADQMEDSLDRISTRALHPYEATGKPVTGTENVSDAPVLKDGSYLDTMPANSEKRFYLLDRSTPGSTMHVGLSAQPGNDQDIKLSLTTGAGDSCGDTTAENRAYDSNNRNQLVLGATDSGEDGTWEEECFSADQLVLTLEVTDGNSRGDTPMELVVSEEPPLASYDGLPAAVEDDDEIMWENVPNEQDPTQTTFGTSFADAVELSDGAFRGSIVPGEVQLFRVPMDWGQQLQTELRVHAQPKLEDVVDGSSDVKVELYNPYRAGVALSSVADASGDYIDNETNIYDVGEEQRIGAVTAPVRYRNREGYDSALMQTAVAGDYYVAVQLGEDDANAAYALTYDLIVSRAGEAGEGEPDYATDGLKSPVPTPSESATADPTPSETPSDSAAVDGSEDGSGSDADAAAADDSGPSTFKLVAGASLGTLGVIALGGAALLLLLRRRRT